MKDSIKFYSKALGIFALIIVLIIAGKLFLAPFIFGANVVDKAGQTVNGVVDKTLNADNALFNYEKFHDDYNAAKKMVQNIQGVDTQINALKATYGNDPTSWPKDVRNDLSFQQQTLQGYQMAYQDIVSRYNADSKKLNRNLFKSKSLPYELPLDYKSLE